MYIYLGQKIRISTAAFIAAVSLFFMLEPSIGISAVFSVLIHESGHLLMGGLCGARIRRITLATPGAVIEFDRTFGYHDGILVYGAGIFFNLISGAFATVFGEKYIVFMLFSLGYALINMIPISGLDGGRLLECVLSFFLSYRVHDTVCKWISFLSLFFLWQCSIYILFKTQINISPFIVCIFLFFELFCRI